jgi:hypothetical protein
VTRTGGTGKPMSGGFAVRYGLGALAVGAVLVFATIEVISATPAHAREVLGFQCSGPAGLLWAGVNFVRGIMLAIIGLMAGLIVYGLSKMNGSTSGSSGVGLTDEGYEAAGRVVLYGLGAVVCGVGGIFGASGACGSAASNLSISFVDQRVVALSTVSGLLGFALLIFVTFFRKKGGTILLLLGVSGIAFFGVTELEMYNKADRASSEHCKQKALDARARMPPGSDWRQAISEGDRRVCGFVDFEEVAWLVQWPWPIWSEPQAPTYVPKEPAAAPRRPTEMVAPRARTKSMETSPPAQVEAYCLNTISLARARTPAGQDWHQHLPPDFYGRCVPSKDAPPEIGPDGLPVEPSPPEIGPDGLPIDPARR